MPKRKAKACKDCKVEAENHIATIERLEEVERLFDASQEQLFNTAQENCQLNNRIEELRKELDSDDVQMGKQRDRLIRLTEISKQAEGFAVCVVRLLNTAERTDELSGKRWFALLRPEYNSTIVQKDGLIRMIAELDVDTAVPPSPRRKP